MANLFKVYSLMLLRIIIIGKTGFSQVEIPNESVTPKTSPIVSEVHTLSVHVQDTFMHDSVYQFLIHDLMLPIYYTPEKYGQTKYAGVYAGNMVLEPCGPFPEIDYAKESFRSMFFGMNFSVYKSLAASEMELNNRGIKQQVNKGSIYVRDTTLCNENIFVGLYEKRRKEIEDSLLKALVSNGQKKPGIEYIKEIEIGYKEDVTYLKWKNFLYPLEIGETGICQINESIQLHFTRDYINEVKSITFKVKSLVKAKQYFMTNDLFDYDSDKRIKLSQTQTYGLSIYLTDKE